MNIVITNAIMQQITETMDNALSIDGLNKDEEQACLALQVFFNEILYGSSVAEAIKQACGDETEGEFQKVVQS